MAADELQTEGAPAPATWDHNAAFWDSVVGDAGNAFHRLLVAPATLELLRLQAGEMVLDVAGGKPVLVGRFRVLG